MKKIKLNPNKGILFWITGLAGSGKTSIAKGIKSKIIKLYGPTIIVSGDDMRKIFDLTKYSQNERLKNAINFSKYSEFITNQKINVIFANIGMFDKARKRNRLRIQNYLEIYIKANLKKIIKIGKKNIYKKFNKNIVGRDIVPELPKSPDIIIHNQFNKSIKELSKELFKKIEKTII